MRKLLLGLAISATFALISHASAETTECTEILSVPTVISTQGVYCFKKNLLSGNTAGAYIDIQVNNVTIDMNGFKLGGLAAGPTTTAIGIQADNRKNIVIRNGSLRGFFIGIELQESLSGSSSGHLIEDVLIDGAIVTGISVNGKGVTIRNNRVVNTVHVDSALAPAKSLPLINNGGGYDNADHGTSSSAGITGIFSESVITNNIVSSLSTDQSQATGIFIQNSTATLVRQNMVANIMAVTNAFGINVLNGSDNTVSDNLIVQGFSSASFGVFGVGSTRLVCAGNIVGNFGTAYTLCTTSVDNTP